MNIELDRDGLKFRFWRINIWLSLSVFDWLPQCHYNQRCCWFWFCWLNFDMFIDQPDSYYKDL